jgi:hypothetical protein
MPIKLNGSTSGYTQVNAAAVAASNTLTLPASNGALVAQSTTTAPTNGQIPIGNGTDYTAATITAGTGITVTNGAGTITLASTSGTPSVLTYNSSSTWTKATDAPAGCTMAMIENWGGGGGPNRSGTPGGTVGGGGGAYTSLVIPISSLAATETVTVGAGGLASTVNATAGGVGGNSVFGSLLTAYGGAGGPPTNVTIPIFYSISSTAGGGGTGISGTYVGLNYDGTTYCINPQIFNGGAGGNVNTTNGNKSVYGGGGGGAGSTNTTGGTSVFGGNGASAAATPAAGVQPSGGGACSTTVSTTGSVGGAGRVKVTMW